MLRYLIFITIGILLYLLLNRYNAFSIGVPHLDNSILFKDDLTDDMISDLNFQNGYRVYTFNTNALTTETETRDSQGNIVVHPPQRIEIIDDYGIMIPQTIIDVGLLYVPTIELIPSDANVDWMNNNVIFISPVNRGENYDEYPDRLPIEDTYTINGIQYRLLTPSERTQLFGMHQFNPSIHNNNYRLVNLDGTIYIYQNLTRISFPRARSGWQRRPLNCATMVEEGIPPGGAR